MWCSLDDDAVGTVDDLWSVVGRTFECLASDRADTGNTVSQSYALPVHDAARKLP